MAPAEGRARTRCQRYRVSQQALCHGRRCRARQQRGPVMNVVPVKAIDRVQFYEDHIAGWTTNATAIGTTSAAVTDLQTKTTAARNAYDAQQAAQQAAKDATLAFHNAVTAMSTAGAAIIKQVRAKAEVSADPNVYVLASIPAPA